MHIRITTAFLVFVTVVPSLSLIVHDTTSDKLEGRQQVSLSKGISAHNYLADSPLLVLAITTKDLRDEKKAQQNAAEKGNLFGAILASTNKWTIFYAKYVPEIYITSQAG